MPMQRAINATRCFVFGLVWGYLIVSVSMFSEFFKPQAFKASHAPFSFPNFVLMWILGGLGFASIGLLLAVPYGIALGIWEARTFSYGRWFLLQSVFTMAVWAALPCTWFIAHDWQYGPDTGFSGEMRWGVVGYVAALVGSYVVGRELPVESATFYYGRHREGIWVVIVLAAVLAIGMSLPTFA